MSNAERQREETAAPGGNGRWHRIRSRIRLDAAGRHRATGTIGALILATVCAQHWLASLPLPWGGPNVVLAGAATLAAAAYAAAILLRTLRQRRNLGWWEMAGRRRAALGLTPPAAGALAVCGLMIAWALAVHLWNGNFELAEWGKLAMGGGVLLAVCVAVNGARRAGILLLAIVLAVWVSAVFGLAMAAAPDPLAYWWVFLADPAERTIGVVATETRIAGLSVETAIFGQQLAVAIPLALAATVGGTALFAPCARSAGASAGDSEKPGHWRRRIGMAAWFAVLATLTVALVINGTRSAEYGAAAGILVGLPLLWQVRRWRQRLLGSLALLGLCLLAAFNPVFDAGDFADWISGAGAASPAPGYGAAPGGNTDTDINTDAGTGAAIFANLQAGRQCADTAGRLRRCYRIGGVNNRQGYLVQLRARHSGGYRNEIGAVTTHSNPERRIIVSWDQASDPEIAGYEFRLRPEGNAGFTPWRELAVPGASGGRMTQSANGAKMAALRTALDLAEFDDGRNIAGLYAFGGWSLRSRLYQMEMAFRYARDYPLGAGRYAPQRSHLGVELDARDEAILLNATIHNQFLRTLTRYGYPGLLLLLTLYALALGALAPAALTALRRGREQPLLLTLAAGMAVTAYLAVSMLSAPGPFAGDWGHFLLLGLSFSVARIGQQNQVPRGEKSK